MIVLLHPEGSFLSLLGIFQSIQGQPSCLNIHLITICLTYRDTKQQTSVMEQELRTTQDLRKPSSHLRLTGLQQTQLLGHLLPHLHLQSLPPPSRISSQARKENRRNVCSHPQQTQPGHPLGTPPGKEGSLVPAAADLFCIIACPEIVTRGKQQRELCIPKILEAGGGS